jgi:hypothetical protein
VGLERYAIAEVLWKFSFEYRGDFGEILNDDFEVGELAGENRVVVTG